MVSLLFQNSTSSTNIIIIAVLRKSTHALQDKAHVLLQFARRHPATAPLLFSLWPSLLPTLGLYSRDLDSTFPHAFLTLVHFRP